MSVDLFEREQRIYDQAADYAKIVADGLSCDPERFRRLVGEYGKMLKYLRRITKLSDQTSGGLHTDNLSLHDKAFYDTLTGLANRRRLDNTLQKIIRSASRSGNLLSVLMIDIDYFKNYNDTYGHGEGDACLRAVARALSSSVAREADLAARYGGEEFTVLMPDTDERGACLLSAQMLKNVSDLKIPHAASEAAGHVTISIGAATGRVLHSMTGDDFIKRADEALYQSKRNGRNRYTHFKF